MIGLVVGLALATATLLLCYVVQRRQLYLMEKAIDEVAEVAAECELTALTRAQTEELRRLIGITRALAHGTTTILNNRSSAMGEGDSFTFSANQQGDGQINQAQNMEGSSNTVNKGGDVTVTYPDFEAALVEGIPPAERPKVEAEVVKPLREIAEQPEPKTEKEKATLKDRIKSLLGKLEPYTPHIRKALAGFAEGALGKIAMTTLPAPASWIVAGAIELCKDNRR